MLIRCLMGLLYSIGRDKHILSAHFTPERAISYAIKKPLLRGCIGVYGVIHLLNIQKTSLETHNSPRSYLASSLHPL